MWSVTFEDLYGQGKYIFDVLERDLRDQASANDECDEDFPPSQREIARRKKLRKAMLEVIEYYRLPEFEYGNYWEVERED